MARVSHKCESVCKMTLDLWAFNSDRDASNRKNGAKKYTYIYKVEQKIVESNGGAY